jgi:hypothetical protein
MTDVYMIQVRACPICHERPMRVKGRCRRCYDYWYKHGCERPPWLNVQVSICTICEQRPIVEAGRCARCRTYWRKHQRERPTTLANQHRGGRLYCKNGCPVAPISHGLCWPCYQYTRRHDGEQRPYAMVKQQWGLEARRPG